MPHQGQVSAISYIYQESVIGLFNYISNYHAVHAASA